jgi:hypothetical protein
MDRSSAKYTRNRFEHEMAKVAKSLGMDVTVEPRSRYDSEAGSVSFKVTCTEAGGRGKADVEWERFADKLGIPSDWLGRSFIDHGNRVFTVVGLNKLAKKYPIKIEDGTGKGFKASVSHMRSWRMLDESEVAS